MPLYFHPLYTDGIDEAARFPRLRYRLTRDEVLRRDEGRTIRLVEPRPADRAAILRAHDADYVDAFLESRLSPAAVREIGLRPWTSDIVPRTLALVGGSLAALDDCLDARGYAANMAGGTHHARRDRGGGYCIFNDIAVAVHRARDRGVGRVLVVDLDVHQGDGTAELFADDADTFTFSLHGATNYPFTKARGDLDVELPRGAGDALYLDTLRPLLDRVFALAPELVIFQAGVDPLAEDKLGHLSLTHAGLRARNEAVFDAADALGVPVLVLMGGGYARPIEATAQAFADLFLEAAARHARRG